MNFRVYAVGDKPAGHMGSDLHLNTDALARTWLETLEMPFAIVDHNLGLYWVNPAAHRQFSARVGFEIKDGIVAPVDPAYRLELRHFVSAARSVASNWSLPWDDGHVLVRATEIHRSQLHRYLGLQFVFTNTFESMYAGIDKAFCLTAREYRIVCLLLKSKRPEQIALELDSRLPTIRTHIRNIYCKTNVANSAELFYRLAPFRIV